MGWRPCVRPWQGRGNAPWITLLVCVLACGSCVMAQAGTVRPLAAIALSIRSRGESPIQDSRCYLMNGGAVESFFISEDTPIGAVIGTLSVNGDPSDDGDITLTVQERNAGVTIAPGSKNVTLARRLDREERAGPSNVYVNVRCDRRRTNDPSFVIPVSVRVWDVNDNAPAWEAAVYRARLSEAAAVGTRVPVTLKAVDKDQPGPHNTLHYSVLPNPFSDYFSFPNELESVLVVAKPLDYESARNLTVTLRAQDQGTPPLHADAELVVEVLDADDQNPKFTSDHYSALLPDDAVEGTILETVPGAISAADQDAGIKSPLMFAAAGDRRELVYVDKDTGRVAATNALLNVDSPVTVVIKATQVDNPDRYALATLSISRRSQAIQTVKFLQPAYSAAVREDVTPGAVVATLHTHAATRISDAPPLQFYVSDRSFLDKFAINSQGEVLLRRPLDYETTQNYFYQVMVTDGVGNDTTSLNISVVNVNEWEPRFRYPQYEFRVTAGTAGEDETNGRGGLLPVGKLDVHDGDQGDTVQLSLRGNDANMFYINSQGEMFLRREALNGLNSSVLHVLATAQDEGVPPRQTSVPVIVHVDGTLTQRSMSARGGVVAGFGGALCLLVVLLTVLLAVICRRRRAKSSPAESPTSKTSTFVSHEAPPTPQALPATGAGGGGTLGMANSGSLLSVSAGASTILAANSSSSLDLRGDTLPGNGNRNATTRQSTRYPSKTKIAPAPPTLPHPSEDTLMSDHLRTGPGRSGVAWPSQTIPARVKKLSWDDNANDKGSSPQPHEATNSPLHDHLNLTVYF